MDHLAPRGPSPSSTDRHQHLPALPPPRPHRAPHKPMAHLPLPRPGPTLQSVRGHPRHHGLQRQRRRRADGRRHRPPARRRN
eukprot:1310187-Rhodomonas_salina.1